MITQHPALTSGGDGFALAVVLEKIAHFLSAFLYTAVCNYFDFRLEHLRKVILAISNQTSTGACRLKQSHVPRVLFRTIDMVIERHLRVGQDLVILQSEN